MYSTTLIAVYNHFCSEAGLTSRMLRRKHPELGVRTVHDAEAKIDPNTGLSERHKPAIRINSQANKRPKDARQGVYQTWTAEWSDGRTMKTKRTIPGGILGATGRPKLTMIGTTGASGKTKETRGIRTCQVLVNLRLAPGPGLRPEHAADTEGAAS